MSRFAGRCRAALCAAVVVVLGVYAPTASAQTAPDFSTPGSAFNVLPPGNSGGIPVTTNSTDQIPLYDGLTPKFDNVTAADLPNFYKANVFGLGGLSVQRTQTFPSRPGLVVQRDSYNVPHVEASSRDDVMYGIGYVTAEDRTLLMDTLRGPGRIAAVDAPGLNPFALAQQLQPFVHAADRGLSRDADRPGALHAGRPADRRRRRQLPRGHQRLPHAGGQYRPAVEPQRRGRGRGTDRRRVRRRRRRRGAPRAAAVGASGPPGTGERATGSGTTSASSWTPRRRCRWTAGSP